MYQGDTDMSYASNVSEVDMPLPSVSGIRPCAHPYHHGDLKNALLNCARSMLGQMPLSAVSLRAVARAAGVSHAAPYRHFANQEALLAALATEGFCDVQNRLSSTVAAGDVGGLCRTYLDFVFCNPTLVRLMFGPQIVKRDGYDELVCAETGLVGEVCRVLGAAELGLAAWAILHGFSMLALEGILDAAGNADPVETLVVRAETAVRRLVG